MSSLPVAAIFDIGRTHKKFLVFDQHYNVVEETGAIIPDIRDEDGDACEDLGSVTKWIKDKIQKALQNPDYNIKVINFSTHGAALVHLDSDNNPVTPLYDYMKPLQQDVCEKFYQLFGGNKSFSMQTGSPALNMLNSGIQLYWLKNDNPAHFSKIKTSLHLPQYFNFVFSHNKHADITSIGCHTGLWDFKKRHYHTWLQTEKAACLLPPAENINTYDWVKYSPDKYVPVGIGIHDSSAALLPFIHVAEEPFVMLSSGTWNITLNPFFKGELNEEQYEKDCLYYLLSIGHKVGSSRIFLGNEYQHQVEKLEKYFGQRRGYHAAVSPDPDILNEILKEQSDKKVFYPETMYGSGPFPDLKRPLPDFSNFRSFEHAYHKLILDLVFLQKISIELICQEVKNLYISGGFIQNKLFMELMQSFLPGWKIYITDDKHASSLGAAVAMHDAWQTEPLHRLLKPVHLFHAQFDLKVNSYIDFFTRL
ncbi:MAG: hypothetical protein EPN39_20315 [Chitinophagaceae bacterium]|nr:MAG: hypothetical protein EPN39_20315 [Chitinophagaceae bacterium]